MSAGDRQAPSPTLPLHDYQHAAVDHLLRNPRAGVFLEPGLGKTAISLTALTPDHLPALVVAPKRVAENVWPEETPKWRPDLTCAVAAGSPAERKKVLAGDADITVIGRDNIADAHAVRRPPWKTLILDELSSFKSRASKRWRYARALSKHIPHVWGLTGTPAPNSLLDLWPQVFLLDAGARLGTTLTEYRARYFTPGPRLPSGVVTRWDLIPGADNTIHQKIEDICLSMQAEGRLNLPPVTFNEVAVPLPPRVRRQYDRLKQEFVLRMDLIGNAAFTAPTAASLTGMLSQMTSGFLYVQDAMLLDDPRVHDRAPEGWVPMHTEKIDAVKEIVEGAGSPVLVFYRFRVERDLLQRALGARTVDEPGVIQDWNRGTVPVLLAHPASAGHGLNMQAGGYNIVWTTPPWSLEDWDQGNGRLHRQGQENPVVIHTLISPGTIDRVVAARLTSKADVQKALMEYLESPI